MKHTKEIRVAVLAILALFILYFGFNYLKGINIFHKTQTFVVCFPKMNGLVEQSPVYIQGYKVGMVDEIDYDFSKADAFCVTFSINHDIAVGEGSVVALVPDGLISGEALDLRLALGEQEKRHVSGDTLPTLIEPDLITSVSTALSDRLDPVIHNLDSITAALKSSLDRQKLQSIVDNANGTMHNVNDITLKVNGMLEKEFPMLLDTVQLVLNDLHQISTDVKDANLKGIIMRVDTAVAGVNEFIAGLNSTDGTVGMLMNDKELYVNLNNTVTSADSLINDLKAHPKRYVHFSLFGKKDK